MSHLAATVTECFKIWDQMKAAGATLQERELMVENSLRASWPFTREWKFVCQTCRDYGLEMSTCPGDATCGRSKEHLPHDFGRPCWCSAGLKFRDKGKTPDDIVQQAARTRPMTRAGR